MAPLDVVAKAVAFIDFLYNALSSEKGKNFVDFSFTTHSYHTPQPLRDAGEGRLCDPREAALCFLEDDAGDDVEADGRCGGDQQCP